MEKRKSEIFDRSPTFSIKTILFFPQFQSTVLPDEPQFRKAGTEQLSLELPSDR